MASRGSVEWRFHEDWLGLLQPEGLVVSIPVLADRGLRERQPIEVQAQLRALCPGGRLTDWRALLTQVLRWPEQRLSEDVEALTLELRDLKATVTPSAVLQDRAGAPLIVIKWTDGALDAKLDGPWKNNAQQRFERLLTEKQAPIGLHISPHALRLTYAPAGEAPGRLTFPVEALITSDGRILVDALVMLLGRGRLFVAQQDDRLLPILKASRERQDEVTEKLAKQVEDALRILLAGFDAANRRTQGALLRGLEGDAQKVYEGLVTVLLRLVFILYAEDRSLLPVEHPVYAQSYSLGGLAERLTADSVLYAGAMEHRMGAWARLCALFRLIHNGVKAGDLHLPARRGDLFYPGRFPFLEGRDTESDQDRGPMPPVDDGCVHQVLERLLHLDGQRISYRNLEVEQIGSVYEAMMGFTVVRALGPAVRLKQGAVVELDALIAASDPLGAVADLVGERAARLASKLPGLRGFKAQGDDEADRRAMVALLQPLIDPREAPIAPYEHYLQPGEDRRRSGSHYTPRSLTEPIVARTLGPVLDALKAQTEKELASAERAASGKRVRKRKDAGEAPPGVLFGVLRPDAKRRRFINVKPLSERILDLKICDPAMGSAAFLAEACRYLAARLVEAWAEEDSTPAETANVDPELLARRKVAERCLYGVDKNPFAVQLARLSLWLVTSDRELPFTFIDHALKEGDALIGVSPEQIAAFDFHPTRPPEARLALLKAAMNKAAEERILISEGEAVQTELGQSWDSKRGHLFLADDEVWDERKIGDLLVAAAWAGGTKKEQRDRFKAMSEVADAWYPAQKDMPLPAQAAALVKALPFKPFHWELEFPEVFSRDGAGFDCVVGNPPFLGGKAIRTRLSDRYPTILSATYPASSGNADLASFFLLILIRIMKQQGTFGYIATNTLSEGDTKASGLAEILSRGFEVYAADTDVKWPVGSASVYVHLINGILGPWTKPRLVNGKAVQQVNSSLKAADEAKEPAKLRACANCSFVGSFVCGKGFVLTPGEAEALLREDPRNQDVVRSYIGGQELNNSPTMNHNRYVINFFDASIEQARTWLGPFSILEERVKPERTRLKPNGEFQLRKPLPQRWWQFADRRPSLYEELGSLERCLASSQVSKYLLLAFQPTNRTFAHTLNIFAFDSYQFFALLQSRTHEYWAKILASSMKTDLRYTPSRCFETFPFPRPTEVQRQRMEETGEALYTLRSEIMLRNEQGMTQVWNRLHDPDEQSDEIRLLRQRRQEMDEAVLDAYGWSDLDPDDRDEILRRLRKLNAERAAEEAAEEARRKKAAPKAAKKRAKPSSSEPRS